MIVAEMWHGPTGAFKDIALGVVAKLVNYFLGESGKHATVLVATSGDTGSAAIHAVLGLDNMDIIVLYPKGRISRIQELQMTTVDAENVTVYGGENCVADDFDTLVKRIFADVDFSHHHNLIMLNSINVGRIVMQTVHYFYAYFKACRSVGDEVLIAVPTGACGNIASGVLAQKMGLPVKFIIGVNHNDVVHKCIMSGCLDQPDDVMQSYASAMDVQVPYNIERVISFITDDTDVVAQQFTSWDATGTMALTAAQQREMRKLMWSTSVTQEEIIETMQEMMSQHNYCVCPHTAVGVFAANKFRHTSDPQRQLVCNDAHLSSTPIVCYATSTLTKFKEVADEAGIAAPGLPSVEALYELPEKGEVLQGDRRNWEVIIRRRIKEISDKKSLKINLDDV